MYLKYITTNIFPLIKLTSTTLIVGAIGLELWHIYAVLTHIQIPRILYPIFWLERLALVSHAIEAIVAAFWAHSRKEIPLKYGTYTFFVGTVGLVELFIMTERE